jgi:DNA polymerase-4
MEIFRSFTPLVEPISLDEAFLDVTGAKRLLGSGVEIGQMIRAQVASQEGITCSVGVATNKFIAKLASDHCKPNGLLEITPAGLLDFLHPLPVEALWGVGAKTAESLHRLGLYKVGDLATTPVKTLSLALGEAAGRALHELSWGRDAREVELDEPDKSIGAEETFGQDLEDEAEILRELLRVIEKASARMRRRELVCYTISIKVRFADFRTITRSKSSDRPLSAITEIYQVASKLYAGLGLDRARLRLIGISLEALRPADQAPDQLILGERDKGWKDANAALDRATARFGKKAVRPARLVEPE